jgi:hypothetical protein
MLISLPTVLASMFGETIWHEDVPAGMRPQDIDQTISVSAIHKKVDPHNVRGNSPQIT